MYYSTKPSALHYFVALALTVGSRQLVLAANDWQTPCVNGTCSWDLPNGSNASGTLQLVRFHSHFLTRSPSCIQQSTNDHHSGAPTHRSQILPPRPDGRSLNATQGQRRRIFSSCVRTQTRIAIISSRVVRWIPSSGCLMTWVSPIRLSTPSVLTEDSRSVTSVRFDALCARSEPLDQPVQFPRRNRSRERCDGPLFDARYELLGGYTIAVSSGNLIHVGAGADPVR